MLNLDFAYLAGVIDSDGYIGIKRSTYSMRVVGDSTQAGYSERVTVKQVQPQAISLLKELFGGSHRIENASAKRGKPLFSWNATDKRAVACLEAVRPFLRIKKEQADNCLALRTLKTASSKLRVAFGRGHVGATARPADISDQMEACYLRGKTLNKVGV